MIVKCFDLWECIYHILLSGRFIEESDLHLFRGVLYIMKSEIITTLLFVCIGSPVQGKDLWEVFFMLMQ